MTPKADDEDEYLNGDEVPGGEDDDTDDSDIDVGLAVWEDAREEGAKLARDVLGIPPPRSNVADAEVETVLAFIGMCSSYFVVDQCEGEYTHETALGDLYLLEQAINAVKTKIEAARTTDRAGKKAHRPSRTNIVKVVETTADDVSPDMTSEDYEAWELWVEKSRAESTHKRAEAIVLGGEGA